MVEENSMRKSRNSKHLADVIERVIEIASLYSETTFPDYAKARLLGEIDFHEQTLKAGFEDRKKNGPPLGIADSNPYFGEKLAGLTSFARMAVDTERREGYGTAKIVENVKHYAYLVSGLVKAD